ncbi:hypothetical protein RB653_007900 [Dictyostelium firmibasis]|uniref:Uncharacterized protein n=1 Tax=Dictyostelium firmibasis TaxID=79012 RepID=A0AAN7YRZ5_9MYCE
MKKLKKKKKRKKVQIVPKKKIILNKILLYQFKMYRYNLFISLTILILSITIITKPVQSFVFKSYLDDHNIDERYSSIINHIESKGHNIEYLNSFSSLTSNDNFVTIGSKKLISNLPLIKDHIFNRIPVVLLNVNKEDKKEFCEMVKNVCTLNGDHNILAYIPKSKNGLEYHRVFNWINNETNNGFDSQSSSTPDYGTTAENGTFESGAHDFNGQFKSITNLLLSNLVVQPDENTQGYINLNAENDYPSQSLIPPTNVTIPFKYFESTFANSFIASIDPALASKVSKQTFSYSITNHIYLYKDVPNDCIYSIVYQNGYILPDVQLGVNDPSKAIGSFITSFGTSNKPTIGKSSSPIPSGGSLFNLESTSPHTVDQTHTFTSEVTTDMSIGVSFDITPDGPGGGASFSENWSSTSSESHTIADYGVNEMSNPVTMESAWMYHQQFPFDVYTWGYQNFGEWYKQAYTSNGKVSQPPPLSTSTLQTSTCWKWKIGNSLIDQNNNELIVNIDLSLYLSYSLIARPGFYDKHHKLFYSHSTITQTQSFDFNAF